MRLTIYLVLFTLILTEGCKRDELINTLPENNLHFDMAGGATLFDPANTKALIIGVLTYEDAAKLGSFDNYHRKDVELMNALINYGVPEENVIGLFDTEATKANIIKALHKIATTSGPETNFIFYFAGHGFNGWLDDAESIYIANYDIKYFHPDKTGFNINYLADNFRPEFPGNSVFLMADCCKSGGLVNVAEKFSDYGYQAVGLTSCFYSDWSTGDWTFTQKVIDALNGDGLIDDDNNGSITLSEMMDGVSGGLKYINRQKYDAAFFNCLPDAIIAPVSTFYADFTDPVFHKGQYVFGKYKGTIRPLEITGKSGSTYRTRLFDFADYSNVYLKASDIKIPYFVSYEIGDAIMLDEATPKPAIITGAEDDFFEVENPANGQLVWHTYEAIVAPGEIPAMILDPYGVWRAGKILDQTATQYYVSYNDRSFQWDEWVTADRITF